MGIDRYGNRLSGGERRRDRQPKSWFACWILASVVFCAAPALAQGDAAAAREAAEAAQKAAASARSELESARRSLEDAATRVADKAREVEELEAQATAAESAREASLADAVEAAERKSADAERVALKALARVKELEERLSYDRSGVYLGGGVFYAPEIFDEGNNVSVKSSVGAMARIGYRAHRFVALDIRYDHLDGFDVFDSTATGTLDGWALSANFRAFPLRGRWQPWIGFGAGVIRTDFDLEDRNGDPVETRGIETDPLLRFAVGFDTYLTTNLVLTVEAALNSVGDDRDYISYGQLGAGLDFRF